MDYINVENITVGDVYHCGKAMLEVLAMDYMMEKFKVRINANPSFRIRKRELHNLLNPKPALAEI